MEGKTYDKKCDVWSLGVILFQLAFGKLPFPIDQGQVVFIKKVTTERVEMPTSLKVPNSLADLIFRALERDPVKRCSVEEFLSS
jgi:serine/threonine protein kinase